MCSGERLEYRYDAFGKLRRYITNDDIARYEYNSSGIRTLKWVDGVETKYILNGGDVVGEVSGGETTTYLRGINLICTDEYYYVFDAHGDVVNLTDDEGSVVKTYDYDAFGVEKNRDDSDTNPFRYCGEYWDSETETYYLRARSYDPNLGRFTTQDTHWNVSNMIYGDNPQKINEREDKLGLKSYSYAPQISAITQSGNLYVYCVNDPIAFVDKNGEWINIAIGAAIGAACGLVISLVPALISGNVDVRTVIISTVGGAVSGGLAASGVLLGGQILGNAIISGVSDILIQNKSFDKIDWESVAISVGMGIVSGLLGGKGADYNNYFSSLSDQFIKRFTKAFTKYSGNALFNELKKALVYFCKSAGTVTLDMLKSILKSYIPVLVDKLAELGDDVIDRLTEETWREINNEC